MIEKLILSSLFKKYFLLIEFYFAAQPLPLEGQRTQKTVPTGQGDTAESEAGICILVGLWVLVFI